MHIVPDAEIGFLGAPGQRQRYVTDEATYIKETDNKGFPNREPWPERVDIVFLGDSLVEGGGVNLDQNFAGLVAQRLPTQGVLNLGLAAAGPERQYRIYQRFGRALRPSIVVAGWYLASDVHNDERFHAWLREGQGTDYNNFRLHVFSRKKPAKNSEGSLPIKRLLNSRLYGMGQELLSRWRGKDAALQDSFRFANGEEIVFEKRALEFAAQAIAADDARIDALFTSLEQLRTLVLSQQAELVVMLIPSKEELYGPGGAPDGASAVARVRQRLQETNLPVVDLYPALRARGDVQSPYFSRDIHLNAYGHRIVAEQFVSWFHAHRRQ
jgi:lysophospholipase L1-like esterase